jgi:hypothetical protein
MKLLSLFFLLPVLAFSIPSTDFTEVDLFNPHLLESGHRIREASSRLIAKRANQKNSKGKTFLNRKSMVLSHL